MRQRNIPRQRGEQRERESGRPLWLATIAGAAPARSALNLRLALACFGFVICATGGILALVLGVVPFGVVLLIGAAIAVIDGVVVIVRKRRRRAGE
jgi:hypothetical protein